APRFVGPGPAAAGVSDRLLKEFASSFASPGPDELCGTAVLPCAGVGWRRCEYALDAATLSEVLGAGDRFRDDALARQHLHPHGVFDALWVTVGDATGHSLALGIGLPEVARLSPSRRSQYARIGQHLTRAFGLRRLLANRSDAASAGACSVPAAQTLRAAAVALSAARGDVLDQDAASAAWQAAASAPSSVVDRFDHGGRKYFIVQLDAAAEAKPESRLAGREGQVAKLAALGHSNKLIAYELSLSASTVAVYLRRAAKKLGVRSRLGLIRLLSR
ncbi:MAG TPA: helix-turn-helix transcriptional regulator, partial [Polyangiaceae bacterium]|nr:helix-turn-helix transcriptional regulator [Polyangiaceae bacterium]